jgi:hypothetical protein
MNRPALTALAALFAALIVAVHPLARAAGNPVTEDLRMVADSQPFRQAADRFVTRAMAGDVEATYALLSRQLVERSGDAAIRRALETQIVPFFRAGQAPGRSVTTTHTTDAAQQRGFAFYMWMQQSGGATQRPFTVYVVQEGERYVVANVVPDRLVEGRHR